MEEAIIRNLLSFGKFWQVSLHSDPQNEATKSTIKDHQSQLQTLMDMKQDGHTIQSRTKWMKYGDRMNK